MTCPWALRHCADCGAVLRDYELATCSQCREWHRTEDRQDGRDDPSPFSPGTDERGKPWT